MHYMKSVMQSGTYEKQGHVAYSNEKIDFGGIAILLLCIENETSPKCAGLNTLTGEICFITDLTICNRKIYRYFYILVASGQDFLSLFD